MILTDAAELVVSEEQLGAIRESLSGLTLMGVVRFVVLLIVLIILVKLLNKLFAKILEKSGVDKTAHGFLKAAVKILLYFLAVLILASSLNIDVTSLIAVLSVVGLALSLAVQGALSNLAGGIVLLVTRPFHVGDYVMIGAEEGFVQEIGMTYTRLSTHDHRTISIPNSIVTASNVVNYSVEGLRRVDLVVTASYDCGIDETREALLGASDMVPQLLADQEKFARVSGYRDSSVEYTVRAWCRNEDYWDAYFGLMESVKRSFDANGISMTYPHLNVHMVEK